MAIAEVKVQGLREAVELANSIGARARDFSGWCRRKALPDFRAAQQRIFATEGAAGQFKWARNAPRYAAWKRRAVGHEVPGRLTGRLGQEMGHNSPYSIDNRTVYMGTTLAVWTDIPYARYMQWGAGPRGSRAQWASNVAGGRAQRPHELAWLRGVGVGVQARPFIPNEGWWEAAYGQQWAIGLRNWVGLGVA